MQKGQLSFVTKCQADILGILERRNRQDSVEVVARFSNALLHWEHLEKGKCNCGMAAMWNILLLMEAKDIYLEAHSYLLQNFNRAVFALITLQSISERKLHRLKQCFTEPLDPGPFDFNIHLPDLLPNKSGRWMAAGSATNGLNLNFVRSTPQSGVKCTSLMDCS